MSDLIVTRDGHVATVRLSDPERLNPLPADTTELRNMFVELGRDPMVRAIVITGTGRGFCSGANVGRLAERAENKQGGGTGTDAGTTPSDGSSFLADTGFTPRRCGIFKPVIAAVNGVCAGAGLHFVADADIVIAAASATFLDTHVSIGQVSALEPILLARGGIPYNAIARMVILGSGERIDARTALRIGMVSEVVADDVLMQRAGEIAALAALASPAAVEASLRAIWEAYEFPLSEAYRRGHAAIGKFRDHPDALEGPRSFNEKRRPVWTVAGTSS